MIIAGTCVFAENDEEGQALRDAGYILSSKYPDCVAADIGSHSGALYCAEMITERVKEKK